MVAGVLRVVLLTLEGVLDEWDQLVPHLYGDGLPDLDPIGTASSDRVVCAAQRGCPDFPAWSRGGCGFETELTFNPGQELEMNLVRTKKSPGLGGSPSPCVRRADSPPISSVGDRLAQDVGLGMAPPASGGPDPSLIVSGLVRHLSVRCPIAKMNPHFEVHFGGSWLVSQGVEGGLSHPLVGSLGHGDHRGSGAGD